MIIFIVDIMPKLQVRESLHLFPPFTLFEVERSRFCTLRHFELAPNRRGHFFGAAPLRDQRARRSYLTFSRVIVYVDLRGLREVGWAADALLNARAIFVLRHVQFFCQTTSCGTKLCVGGDIMSSPCYRTGAQCVIP